MTSCSHEVEKEAFEQHVTQSLSESNSVKCPVCNGQLPQSDYKQFASVNSFEEFKQKNISILKAVLQIEKQGDEFHQLVMAFEAEERQKASSRENSQSPSS